MAEEQARAASPAPERRSGGGGRGFIAGLLGGVLGAGGSIYALQVPEVRENLPLPPQAELIVNPDAVARISALEQEFAQLRGAVREAEETASIDGLRARIDQLSEEVTRAATSDQLAGLRDGLSPLARPEGAAALDERLSALETDLGGRIGTVGDEVAALEETAARRSNVAALEAAVDGFASRLGTLEEGQSDLAAVVAELETLGGELSDRTATLADRIAQDETALVERGAALAGRIDALARDIAGFRESLGAADARFSQLEEATAEELTTMRAAIDAIAARTEGVEADTAALEEALATTEATVAEFTATMRREADAFRGELASQVETFTAELGERVARIQAAVAAAGERAEAAVTTAADTRDTVATALARTRAAAGVNAAASQVDAALASGDPLGAAVTTLDGLATEALDPAERSRLDNTRAALVVHEDGVATAGALQRSLDDLRPALIDAVAPEDGDGGVAGTLMDSFNLRARGVSAEVANTLETMAQALARGDVAAAVAAAQDLPAPAREVLASWLEAARAHAAVADARGELLDLGRELAAAAGGS
jgi:predicted  nucleic acid-binding Zn-ribbon protein